MISGKKIESYSKANVVVSWTGGKDSCLSCHMAMLNSLNVIRLLNFRDLKKKGSHTINPELLTAQMQATGIPFMLNDFVSYEREFKKTVHELNSSNAAIEGAVFGHIQTHDSLVDRICSDLGIEVIMPLWKRNSEQIISDLVEAGFTTIIVSVKANLMGSEWLGRTIDRKFVKYLHLYDSTIDPCGEDGEFHTFVTDGPIFRQKLEITDSMKVLEDGYWFLDVLQFETVEK